MANFIFKAEIKNNMKNCQLFTQGIMKVFHYFNRLTFVKNE